MFFRVVFFLFMFFFFSQPLVLASFDEPVRPFLLLMSLSGLLCGFLVALGLILVFRK